VDGDHWMSRSQKDRKEHMKIFHTTTLLHNNFWSFTATSSHPPLDWTMIDSISFYLLGMLFLLKEGRHSLRYFLLSSFHTFSTRFPQSLNCWLIFFGDLGSIPCPWLTVSVHWSLTSLLTLKLEDSSSATIWKSTW